MSLATRCTSCGTVFRVVQDQLRVSEGWVRCGRCDAVFNAAEGLFDVDREAAPSWSPTQLPVVARTAGLAASPDDALDDPAPSPADLGVPAALGSLEASRPRSPGTGGLHREAFEAADDTPDPGPADPGSGPVFEATTAFEEPAVPSAIGWHPDAERDPAGRRWRAALAVAAVLLVVLLAAQAAAQFGEIASARWPAMRPVLAGWCSVAGCSTAAPRRIQDIVVDSSALAPVLGTDALKLAISLRNRGEFAVAVPSVDLSLTDSGGQLLARRTLNPADFHVTAASLAAGGEIALQALFTAGAATVTGYTVEIFYP